MFTLIFTKLKINNSKSNIINKDEVLILIIYVFQRNLIFNILLVYLIFIKLQLTTNFNYLCQIST